MDGRKDEWMDGWMDGWTDGWMDRWMDGWMCTGHFGSSKNFKKS